MQPVSANTGWDERNQLFHENYDKSKPFRKCGLTLFGRLMHELVSCETGVYLKIFLLVFSARNLVACAKAPFERVQMLYWGVLF